MSIYLAINIFIVIVPAILSFESKIRYYLKLRSVLLSMVIAGIPFITWDSIATLRGDWGFNDRYTLPIRIFHLPLEEILFFITVPYSMIFLYETFSFYVKNFEIKSAPFIAAAAGLVSAAASFFFIGRSYTFTVLAAFAVFIFAAFVINRELLKSRTYWLFMLFSYIPFFAVNLILTYLPIVWYRPTVITGIRVISVPIEDFLYSFALVSLYLLFYIRFEEIWKRKK